MGRCCGTPRHTCEDLSRSLWNVPRKPRIDYEGAVQHVAVNGNNREAMFLDNADRRRCLRLLGQTATTYGWEVWSYCLMDTHWHMLLRTPQLTLSAGMRRLNSCYARLFNLDHGRTGHSIRHRFMSVPVEDTDHLRELSRYLPLNPVRGGLVSRPEAWLWSSYRAELRVVPAQPWLHADWAVALHGTVAAHREFVNAGIAEPGAAWTPGSDRSSTRPRPAG